MNKRNGTEHNVTDKLSKLKHLKIDVSRMWNLRKNLVPFITESLGTDEKELDQNSQLLPGQRSASELQKVTLMSIAQSFP